MYLKVQHQNCEIISEIIKNSLSEVEPFYLVIEGKFLIKVKGIVELGCLRKNSQPFRVILEDRGC